jgi:hypothetical protein
LIKRCIPHFPFALNAEPAEACLLPLFLNCP